LPSGLVGGIGRDTGVVAKTQVYGLAITKFLDYSLLFSIFYLILMNNPSQLLPLKVTLILSRLESSKLSLLNGLILRAKSMNRCLGLRTSIGGLTTRLLIPRKRKLQYNFISAKEVG